MISRVSFRIVIIASMIGALVAAAAFAQAPSAGTEASPTAPAHLKVGNHELKRFAGALHAVQHVEISYEKRINRAFAHSPMTERRYYQIYNAKERGQQVKPRESATEGVQFKELTTAVSRLQSRAEKNMIAAVHHDGFKVARFNQILDALHTDPSLAKRFEQVQERS